MTYYRTNFKILFRFGKPSIDLISLVKRCLVAVLKLLISCSSFLFHSDFILKSTYFAEKVLVREVFEVLSLISGGCI